MNTFRRQASTVPEFSLVICFIVALQLSAVAARPSLMEAMFRKKISTSFCNVEFKQTFIEPDFKLLTNAPTAADSEIKSMCPFTLYSCCTANEMRQVLDKFMGNMQTLTDYFGTVQKNLGAALLVKTERLTRIFDRVHIKVKEDESVTNKVCRYGFNGPKKEARRRLGNVQVKVKWILDEIDNVNNLIKRFYSGFVCSVCDLYDHQFVQVNDGEKLTSMTFDPNICEAVFKIRYKHYKVVREVMDLFDLVNSILCMSSRSAKNFVYFLKLKQELDRKSKEMENCVQHGENDADDMSHGCFRLCAEKLFFQMYIDNFDLLTLSNFIKVFMNNIKRGKLRRASKREIQSNLYFAIDFTFKQSSKRRTFHLNQPRFQNFFSNEKFKRRFKSNAINFMVKAPNL